MPLRNKNFVHILEGLVIEEIKMDIKETMQCFQKVRNGLVQKALKELFKKVLILT